jgi:hypothetical protein
VSVDPILAEYAPVSLYGKEGIFNVAVCVKVMVSPLGSLTAKCVGVGILFEHLALAKIKFAVHPESKSAVYYDGMDGLKLR